MRFLPRRHRLQDLRDILPLPWEDAKVVAEIDGYDVCAVRTPFDYGLEGYLLAHCLGTKDDEFREKHRVYSIRDRNGVSHCTILYYCGASRNESPYGICDDFGSSRPGRDGNGQELHLLQVRGREDQIAHPDYHEIARRFHETLGGEILVPEDALDAYCSRNGDKDYRYHDDYTLDTWVNWFNPGFWRKEGSKRAEALA